MSYLHENNNKKSGEYSHTPQHFRENENADIQFENLEEDGDLQPIENLRRNDESEDFNFVFENIKTKNIAPIPLIIKSNQGRERKYSNPAFKESFQFEDLSENQAFNSTFNENKCSPLQLEISPIRENTLDEDFQNLLISDASSDWYTIEQWKIHETTQLSCRTHGLTDSELDKDSSVNHCTHERAIDSNNKMESEQLYTVYMSNSSKDSEGNESCFEEKSWSQNIDQITIKKEISHAQEMLLKLPKLSKNEIPKAANWSINESIDKINSLEENESKNGHVSKCEDDIGASKRLREKESLTDINRIRKYKSTRVQNENIISSLQSRTSTRKMLYGYDNNQSYESKNNESKKKYDPNYKKKTDSNNATIDNEEVINNECTVEYDIDCVADSDFGQIRQNNRSDNEVYIYRNRTVSTENSSLLAKSSPKYSSSP